jgi:hypothetical protein
MDVDISPVAPETVPATANESSTVVCLPYSLVPGLDTTSRAYQKAVLTLSKQRPEQTPVVPLVPLISALDRGTIHVLLLLSFLLSFSARHHHRCFARI